MVGGHNQQLRTKAHSLAHGQRGADPKLARRIGARGNHTPLLRATTDGKGFAAQGWIALLFHRAEKGV